MKFVDVIIYFETKNILENEKDLKKYDTLINKIKEDIKSCNISGLSLKAPIDVISTEFQSAFFYKNLQYFRDMNNFKNKIIGLGLENNDFIIDNDKDGIGGVISVIVDKKPSPEYNHGIFFNYILKIVEK